MMTMTQEKICDVRVDSDGWNAIEPAVLAELCLEAIAAVHPQARQPVSILFTDDAAMTALNAEYRAKEGTTNVLSFPAGDALPPGESYLGDIALAVETCQTEAMARGVSLGDHAAHLIVHGVLHLIGYDHGRYGCGGDGNAGIDHSRSPWRARPICRLPWAQLRRRLDRWRTIFQTFQTVLAKRDSWRGCDRYSPARTRAT